LIAGPSGFGSCFAKSARRPLMRGPMLARPETPASARDLVVGQEHESEGLSGLNIGLDRGQQRLQPISAGIGGGQHRKNARHRLRRDGVDPVDLGVRVCRAQHHRVRQAIKGEVVEIATLPIKSR
jgi:hypothetical protein